MARIVSPIVGYNGRDPQGVVFLDGVAEVNDPEIVERYRAAGFGVDDEVVRIGTPLRDAAVDLRPGDVIRETPSPRVQDGERWHG